MLETHYDLFISYRSTDVSLAQSVYERLVGAGFSVWFDRRDLAPGSYWNAEIEEGRDSSRIILPLLTPDWKASQWCLWETYGGEHVVPLLCQGEWEDVAPMPLHRYHHFDLRDPATAEWEKLFRAIREYVARPRVEAARRVGWLPCPHNPNFVGRERVLLEIHERLRPAVDASQSARALALTPASGEVVAGGAGYGKTTIAREYVEQFWQSYDQVLWVRAEDVAFLECEFARLAQELRQVRDTMSDPANDARWALRELNGPAPRLLVMDNAEDPELIAPWLPNAGGCRVLITSRCTVWPAGVHVREVDLLEAAAACDLLLNRSGFPANTNNEIAKRLAGALGYLPLALEQAAAFVKEAGINFERYLEYLADTDARRDLFALQALGSTQYPCPLARTWLTTIERLTPLARATLTLSAFFAPDDIPRDLVYVATDRLTRASFSEEPSPGAESGAQNPMRVYVVDRALGELKRYSLLTKLDEQAYALHRLVQTIHRDSLDAVTYRQWAELAVLAVSAAMPTVEFSNREFCERLLPHAQAVAQLVAQFSFETAEAGRVLNEAGYLYRVLGNYAAAEPLLQQALEIRRKALGEEHSDFATSVNNVARLYRAQGNYAVAERLYKQALEIRRKALGEEHPDVAVSLDNLGDLYRACGANEAAEPLLKRALEIRRKMLGEECPEFATSLTHLGALYRDQRHYAAAEPLLKRALDIRAESLGDGHWKVANSLKHLGLLLIAQGNYAVAEPLLRRALDIHAMALGEEHPHFALSLNAMAHWHHAQGNYPAAEPLYLQALEIHRKAVGEAHPYFAKSLRSLGETYLARGDYAAAEPLLAQAKQIYRKVLGEEPKDFPSVGDFGI